MKEMVNNFTTSYLAPYLIDSTVPAPARGGGPIPPPWLYFPKRVGQSCPALSTNPRWFWQRGLYCGSNSEPAMYANDREVPKIRKKDFLLPGSYKLIYD